jgi:uncharacterized protein DUF6855
MSTTASTGSGTREDPWVLSTPPGKAQYTAYEDPTADPPALVVVVGSTELRYHLRCIADLHEMLRAHGDWMALGNADEQKPAADGTVEAWGGRRITRSAAGTASRRGSAAGSAITSHPFSSGSSWPRSSTTRATTECGRSDRGGLGG